jgi:hypothetical protein
MNKLSILHIAPENTAGVPFSVTEMQNRFGLHARLLTFYRNPYNFPEDVCLDIPLPRNRLAMKWRKMKRASLSRQLSVQNADKCTNLPYFKPKNFLEGMYMKSRERKNEVKFLQVLQQLNPDNFNVIHFEGGMDYYKDSRLARKWKQEGKKIVCCYYGDDLRTRGIVKEVDQLSDLNLCFEYDHTLRHSDINFLFYPFDTSNIEYISDEVYNRTLVNGRLRIVHSPTERNIKGTPAVKAAIEKVKGVRNIEFVMAENMFCEKVIEIKKTCHIAIDQVGNRAGTGYGINSLETLSMGLPTITDMNCGMYTWLPENPFIIANEGNLAEKLIEIIDNEDYRMQMRAGLRKWVEKYHSYESVFPKMMEYYKKNGII